MDRDKDVKCWLVYRSVFNATFAISSLTFYFMNCPNIFFVIKKKKKENVRS